MAEMQGYWGHSEYETKISTVEDLPGAGTDSASGIAAGDPGFGLYIHWPFCLSKCPYCAFNSHESAAINHPRWRQALLREIDHMAARIGEDGEKRPLTSIFFGGGTPSLMEADCVAALIERAGNHFSLSRDIEITLEANPTSVEAGRFAEFRTAEVNHGSLRRASVGKQGFSLLRAWP